jgi:rod shape-determining protein MreD
MTKRIFMILVIAAGALCQLFLPAWPFFGGVKPPVLAALVLYYSLNCAPREMWIAVFWAALLHDGLSVGRPGPALIAFPVIGYLAHRVRLEIFVDGLVTQIIVGALGAMLSMFAAILVYALNGERPFHFGYALVRLFGSGILGMATLPLVAFTVNKAQAALPKRRGYGWQ